MEIEVVLFNWNEIDRQPVWLITLEHKKNSRSFFIRIANAD